MFATEEAPLTARSGSEEYDLFVYTKARDGTGPPRVLPAHGRVPSNLTFCTDHFIARGVCIDCTREAGQIIYAS